MYSKTRFIADKVFFSFASIDNIHKPIQKGFNQTNNIENE